MQIRGRTVRLEKRIILCDAIKIGPLQDNVNVSANVITLFC